MATATLTIWYLPGPAELNVELILWQFLATAIAALVTFLVEVVLLGLSKLSLGWMKLGIVHERIQAGRPNKTVAMSGCIRR